MHFSRQAADPRRSVVGLSLVAAIHVAVVYALVTGLAKRAVDVVRAPIETKVIEEITKPPPPPPVPVVPPPPRLEAPPPPFVPPPEVQVEAPPPQQPTITATAPTPAPTPQPMAPPVAPAPDPPAPEVPVRVSAAVACSNYASVMGEAGFPNDATRLNLDKGQAIVQFKVEPAGTIRDIRVISASHPVFARSSARIVANFKCQGQGHDVLVQVPFAYKLE